MILQIALFMVLVDPQVIPAAQDAVVTASAAAPPPAATSPAGASASSGAQSAARGTQQGSERRQPIRLLWRDRPSLGAGRWLRLDLTSRVHVDGMHPGDDPADFDAVRLRRARVGVDGELFRVFEFSIERELTDAGDVKVNAKSVKTQWRDVYGDLRFTDAFRVRGGRFKIPFGLDQLTSTSQNDFAFRSLGAEHLAPGRDVGVMLHGRLLDRRFNYWAGAFDHDGDNSRSSKVAGGDRTFAFRISGTPLARITRWNLDRLEIGGNIATTDVSDVSELPNGLRGRTVVSEFTFFEPVFVRGTRNRYGMDLDWDYRRLGARAELLAVTDERNAQGLSGDNLDAARARAYYVEGTWLVTADRKARPMEPRRPLFVRGAGAVELAARYERIRFDSRGTGAPAFSNPRAEVILPTGDHVVTLGVNWYLNRWSKLQLDAIHEDLQDPGRTPLPDGRTGFWSTVLRLQFAM